MAFQKNMRVLIVDDTSTSRMLIRDALEQLGMTVTLRREMGSDIMAACGQLRRGIEGRKEL